MKVMLYDNDPFLPQVRRLSAGMKREFVETLKTPALLAMFSKDPICTAYAHAAIKYLAALEPSIIMPQVLERSYNGLESINEVSSVRDKCSVQT